MIDKIAFGQAIRQHREASGMSVTQLAEAVGVTSRYIYQIEAGERVPRLDVIFGLVNVLQIPTNKIFGMESEADKSIQVHTNKQEPTEV